MRSQILVLTLTLTLTGCTAPDYRDPVPVAPNHPADAALSCAALEAEHVRVRQRAEYLEFRARQGPWPGARRASGTEATAYSNRADSLALIYAARCGGPMPPAPAYVHTFPPGYFDGPSTKDHPEGTGAVEAQNDGESADTLNDGIGEL